MGFQFQIIFPWDTNSNKECLTAFLKYGLVTDIRQDYDHNHAQEVCFETKELVPQLWVNALMEYFPQFLFEGFPYPA